MVYRLVGSVIHQEDAHTYHLQHALYNHNHLVLVPLQTAIVAFLLPIVQRRQQDGYYLQDFGCLQGDGLAFGWDDE